VVTNLYLGVKFKLSKVAWKLVEKYNDSLEVWVFESKNFFAQLLLYKNEHLSELEIYFSTKFPSVEREILMDFVEKIRQLLQR